MNSKVRIVLGVVAGACIVTAFGCAHTINPFVDDSASSEELTTASERAARQAEKTPVIRCREWDQTSTTYAAGGVIHWPLWFEDPFEDKGSQDGKFAWTAEDYIAWPYSFGRLLLNTMGWPVSAVVTPPGTPMVSDGRLSHQALGMDHDAIPLKHAAHQSQKIDESDSKQGESEQMAEEPEDLESGEPVEGPPLAAPAGFEP